MTAVLVDFTIRPSAAFDVPLIAALHTECFAGHEVWNEVAVAGVLAMPGAYGLLAASARPAGAPQEPAGFLFARAAAEACEILSLGVLPAWRRRGAGRALLQAALGHARTLGLTRAYLEAAEDNAPACRLYAAEGFTQTAGRLRDCRHTASEGVAALVLARDLPRGGAAGTRIHVNEHRNGTNPVWSP
jgi:ribosomal-protein-alanine N-acetyltransferase